MRSAVVTSNIRAAAEAFQFHLLQVLLDSYERLQRKAAVVLHLHVSVQASYIRDLHEKFSVFSGPCYAECHLCSLITQ